MPFSPLSDRQSTVAYAIDLLRAHQIRRENVFLHEQLKTCLKEVVALGDEVRTLKTNVVVSTRDDIKDLKLSIQANSSTVQKALALAEKNELRLYEQSHQIRVVEQSHKATESEISGVKMLSTKAQEDEDARTVLRKQVQALQADCQNLDVVQRRHAQHIQVTFESFQTALDEKADNSTIALLEDQLETLRIHPPAVEIALPPVSRVSESVQVVDSQQQDDPNGTATSPEPPDLLGSRLTPRQTVPEDLDLDANAPTVSYAGHYGHVLEQNESLKMLPPSTAQATQLARVKTLRQGRFDDWTSYYDQGHKLMESLPSSFEGTVVHNFVDGIFKAAHKKQCRQWLDSSGWTWANITAFPDLCSQVEANNGRDAVTDTSDHAKPPRQMKDLLAAAGATEEGGHRKDQKKPENAKARRDIVHEPIRRSQRLVEKDSQHTHLHEMLPPKTTAARPAKTVPLCANVNKKDITKIDETAGDVSKVMKRTQPKVAGKHVHKLQRKETEKDTPAGRRVANVHPNTVASHVLKAPNTRKRNSEPIEGWRAPKRPKSNKRNTSNYEHSEPKLVSPKRQVTKEIQESSDDEGFFSKENRPRQSAFGDGGKLLSKRRPAKYSSNGVQRKKDRKQQRLPLPPPPEIPITSTTDEE